MKLTFDTHEKLEFNDKFKFAYDFLENSRKNVFITGKAGTGKSTLLKFFFQNSSKNVAVLAPTGVAAVNIHGQTIHSFFKFKPDITPDSVEEIRMRKTARRMYQKIDTIVIDEISMVRADLLDCVDKFLQLHGKYPGLPFGGVQMVFFGDLFQLPPVVTNHEKNLFGDIYQSPYFFDSNVFKNILSRKDHPLGIKIIELTKIYRQKEQKFVELLSMIRNRTITHDQLNQLNKRFNPSFVPQDQDFYIYLTTTNAMADGINRNQLNQLYSDEYEFEGEMTGRFEMKNLPTHSNLKLKKNAQVMLLNNDPQGRYINGSVGRIESIDPDNESIVVELSDGSIVDVNPFTWEMYRFYFDEETERLESESIGSFRQFPIRLAWAVTIHKSQGKTFPRVIVDLGTGAFAQGQVYVALSRCSSFDGLILKRKVQKRDILLDGRIQNFFNNQEILDA